MSSGLPLWVEVPVAALLAGSGVFVLVSAIGFVRVQAFFLRVHPTALAYTLGSWCVALAGVLYLSLLESSLRLHPLLIPLISVVTVPVTTVVLARASLFRRRAAGVAGTPPPLTPPSGGSQVRSPGSAEAE